MTIVKSNYEEKHNELYETDYWATDALLRHAPIQGLRAWEPCAGNHKIVSMLFCAGAREVVTSDIETYNVEHDFIADFLTIESPQFMPRNIDAIYTNPPYGPQGHTAAKFCRKALKLVPNGHVAMLLTAKFDSGSTRVDLFRDNPRFLKKITLIDRIQWFEGPCKGTGDHAWFLWGPSEQETSEPVMCYEGVFPSHASRRAK